MSVMVMVGDARGCFNLVDKGLWLNGFNQSGQLSHLEPPPSHLKCGNHKRLGGLAEITHVKCSM